MKKYSGFTLTELIVVIAMGSVFFSLVFYLVNHSFEMFNELDSTNYEIMETRTINSVFSDITRKTNSNEALDLVILEFEDNTIFKVIDSDSNLVEELIVYENYFVYGDYEYQFKEYKINIVYNPEFNKYFIVEYYQNDLLNQEVFYVIRGIINAQE